MQEKIPEKKYLYHMVPNDMTLDENGNAILYPLNMLKEKFPELYEVKIQKYKNDPQHPERTSIPEKLVPTLKDAAWGDVVQLSPIHPKDLIELLKSEGFNYKHLKFYQVDPNKLNPENTTIFLYKKDVVDSDPENYSEFSEEKLKEHSVLPQRTKDYYRNIKNHNEATPNKEDKKKLYLFIGVPHVFHKGPIDVSNFPVISAEQIEETT